MSFPSFPFYLGETPKGTCNQTTYLCEKKNGVIVPRIVEMMCLYLIAVRDLRETIDEIAKVDSLRSERRFSTPCKEESCQQPEYVLFKCTPTATPVEKLNYELNESPSIKRRTPTTKNKSLSILETTVGGSIKCSAYTKSGSRCRNAAQHCMETCRVHTPQK